MENTREKFQMFLEIRFPTSEKCSISFSSQRGRVLFLWCHFLVLLWLWTSSSSSLLILPQISAILFGHQHLRMLMCSVPTEEMDKKCPWHTAGQFRTLGHYECPVLIFPTPSHVTPSRPLCRYGAGICGVPRITSAIAVIAKQGNYLLFSNILSNLFWKPPVQEI